MDIVLMILFMIFIGALIGGVTNHLAIKMLFRPHKAIYVGKYRLPFTPGLIPKRRDELAVQMGRMVTDHLLTPEGLRKKIESPKFKSQALIWVQNEVDQLLFSSRNETISDVLNKFGVDNASTKIKEKIKQYLHIKIKIFVTELKSQRLDEIVPDSMIKKIDGKIQVLAKYILDKGIEYFESEEGKRQIAVMIENFFATRGTLVNMIQMFLGNDSIANKIQPEIIKFLKSEGTEELVTNLLNKEWEKVKEMKLEKIDELVDINSAIEKIQERILEEINIDGLLEKSVADALSPYKDAVLNKWLPIVLNKATQLLENRIEILMKRMHLAEIVKEQVESFAVERLEVMVLSISRREFKMITYLGALLGGIIGFFQWLVVYFVG